MPLRPQHHARECKDCLHYAGGAINSDGNANAWRFRPVSSAMGGDRNMEAPTPAELREKALRYRGMVLSVSDQRIIDALISMAEEYEALANHIEKAQWTK
jgi:hypothetical protein